MTRENLYRLFLTGILLSAWLSLSAFNKKPTQIAFHEVAVFYTFGETISFSARYDSQHPIREALLYVAIAGQSTRVFPLQVDAAGVIRHNLDTNVDPIRSFAKVDYWFQATDAQGVQASSRDYSFVYADDRFEWTIKKDGQFAIAWNSPNPLLDREILEIARRSYESALFHFPKPATSLIRIYIYQDADDLRMTMTSGQHPWAVGQATPEDGSIVIVLPPGRNQRQELERLLPHEMTHIIQYAFAGENYASLPAWLAEGTASIAELAPDKERQAVTRSAALTDTLIPLSELCESFPSDDAKAYLAYGQSESFVRYLTRVYGGEMLLDLAAESRPGRSCAQAFETAFGQSLEAIEREWIRDMGGASQSIQAGGDWRVFTALLILLILTPLAPIFLIRSKTGRDE